jgi:hypothetical protein
MQLSALTENECPANVLAHRHQELETRMSEQQPDLLVDPEFSTQCWPLLPEELQFLADLLSKEGCRDPVRYWAIPDTPLEKCPIVDGHNRYQLCRLNNLGYKIQPLEFSDRQAAIEWIVANQLGRRNASEVQKANLRGKLYRERAADVNFHSGSSPTQPHNGNGVQGPPLAALPEARGLPNQSSIPTKPNVARDVAELTGVTEQRVYKAFTPRRSALPSCTSRSTSGTH